MKFPLHNGVAVITGAASGIGRATALALAARGCHLALVDRQAQALEATAHLAEARGVRVSQHVLDVSHASAVAALPGAVLAHHGRVTVLINNAGVALVGRFEDLSMEEFRWLIEINFLAVVTLTKVFLPILMRQSQAQIVNISSVFGIIAPPEQTAYVASKFAVRGFSEALRHELHGSPVGVTVVHPGGVRTAIATSARVAAAMDPAAAARDSQRFTDMMLRLPPEKAAETIVRGMERRRERVLVGVDAHAADVLHRLAPARYWSLIRRQYEQLRNRRH